VKTVTFYMIVLTIAGVGWYATLYQNHKRLEAEAQTRDAYTLVEEWKIHFIDESRSFGRCLEEQQRRKQ